jgi:toxin ParE1/3/4
MARILKRVAATRDVTDHFVFLAENASVDVARRFLQAAHSTFQELAEMPEIGVTRVFRNPRFANVRKWPIKGFERYLIFYRPLQDAVEIIRVLHGARDIESLFS